MWKDFFFSFSPLSLVKWFRSLLKQAIPSYQNALKSACACFDSGFDSSFDALTSISHHGCDGFQVSWGRKHGEGEASLHQDDAWQSPETWWLMCKTSSSRCGLLVWCSPSTAIIAHSFLPLPSSSINFSKPWLTHEYLLSFVFSVRCMLDEWHLFLHSLPPLSFFFFYYICDF